MTAVGLQIDNNIVGALQQRSWQKHQANGFVGTLVPKNKGEKMKQSLGQLHVLPTLSIATVVLCLALVFPTLTQASPSRSEASDEQAVMKVVNLLSDSWSSNDMNTYVSLFAPVADSITSRGEIRENRASIESSARKSIASAKFRDSRHKRTSIKVRLLATDSAIADSDWEISNLRGPDGSVLPPRKGHSTMVLVKVGKRWLVTALRSMIPANGE